MVHQRLHPLACESGLSGMARNYPSCSHQIPTTIKARQLGAGWLTPRGEDRIYLTAHLHTVGARLLNELGFTLPGRSRADCGGGASAVTPNTTPLRLVRRSTSTGRPDPADCTLSHATRALEPLGTRRPVRRAASAPPGLPPPPANADEPDFTGDTRSDFGDEALDAHAQPVAQVLLTRVVIWPLARAPHLLHIRLSLPSHTAMRKPSFPVSPLVRGWART